MKQMKREMASLSKNLKTLTRKVEKMLEKIDNTEKAQAKPKKATTPKKAAKKTAKPRKAAITKKAAKKPPVKRAPKKSPETKATEET